MTPLDDSEQVHLFVSDWEAAPGRLPATVTTWAIGDVHGRADLLDALLAEVRRRAAGLPAGRRHLILLGDYIDRGPDSIAALERAATTAIDGVTVTALRGNHEDYLYDMLRDEDADAELLNFWISNGGLATLANLGVGPVDIRRQGADAVIGQIRATAPAWIVPALDRLGDTVRLGDYLFVHAGVDPHLPLAEQPRRRLSTIREPFLSGAGWRHDFAVVHGHSIIGPDLAPHRVSIDSGAFWTGVLTCVELRGDQARFIAATNDDDLEMLRRIPGRRSLSAETWRPLPEALIVDKSG